MHFLLELRSEEIPARMQEKAAADLVRLFAAEIARAGLLTGPVESFVTPRRLALIARDLPAATAPVSEEIKGPRAAAPPQALEGFLRKTGLARDQLVERDGVLFAVLRKPGRATADVLAEAVPAIVRGFPWPKSMRWGAASTSTESLRWVRPLQGIVALLDDAVVPIEIAGIVSGRETVGHRFLHHGPVPISSAAAYAETLRAAHVIVDADERRALVRDGARAAAAAAGLTLVEDDGLVSENAGLAEWPVPLLGRFDPAFLSVPREVIQLTMRTNQKYFACTGADGALAPAFVCTANIAATDGGAGIVAGNAKVLAARLADARFFWDQDVKVPLADQAEKLAGIVFHDKLGTVADKAERVAKLARWLVEEGIVAADPELTEQAGRLCKADLVTGMVGEFPELQGVMGGYYAAAQGLDPQVAAAIRDHYKPVGQANEVPTAPVTVAVAVADKLDTLSRFFAVGLAPTGSKDPFALRRAGLGVLSLILKNDLRISYKSLLLETGAASGFSSFEDFLIERLKFQQREAGVRHDLIDAVFALGGEDDLVRLLARVKALQAFVETGEGADLLAGYRRGANILRAEGKKDGASSITRHPGLVPGSTDPQAPAFAGEWTPEQGRGDEGDGETFHFPYAPDPAERALADALDAQLPLARAAIAAERFADAMAALSALRPAIDRFFDEVTVNSAVPAERDTRLALLAKLVAAMHKVADFSKIEG